MQYIKKNTYIFRKPILKSYHMPLRKQQKIYLLVQLPLYWLGGAVALGRELGGLFRKENYTFFLIMFSFDLKKIILRKVITVIHIFMYE